MGVTREFIDLSLRYAGAAAPSSLRQRVQPKADYIFSKDPEIENGAIVSTILNEGLIIERSPPEWISIGKLIDKSTVGAGVSLAIAAISTNQWLLFVSVPGGIVLMGAAVGLAKGLQAGIHHSVERYIKRRFK